MNTTMLLLEEICERYNVSAAQVFRCANEYEKKFDTSEDLRKFFLSCCGTNQYGIVKLFFVPEFVDNFCLDVLAGRTKMPTHEMIYSFD